MTRKLLLLSALQLVGFGLFAQQQTTTRTEELKPMKLQPATSTGTTSSVSKDSLAGETIEHLNAVINAIDSKVAYIKSDQTENKKATESGWFDMMAKQRDILVAKREALIQRQNQNLEK